MNLSFVVRLHFSAVFVKERKIFAQTQPNHTFTIFSKITLTLKNRDRLLEFLCIVLGLHGTTLDKIVKIMLL
jgi:hypothetical protein